MSEKPAGPVGPEQVVVPRPCVEHLVKHAAELRLPDDDRGRPEDWEALALALQGLADALAAHKL